MRVEIFSGKCAAKCSHISCSPFSIISVRFNLIRLFAIINRLTLNYILFEEIYVHLDFRISSGEIFNRIIRSRLNVREIIFRCIYLYVCMCMCLCLKIAENGSEICNKNLQQKCACEYNIATHTWLKSINKPVRFTPATRGGCKRPHATRPREFRGWLFILARWKV